MTDRMDKIWYVYMLSCNDNTYYTGVTNDLTRRVRQHNGLLEGGAKRTAGRKPFLVWYLEVFSRSSAQKLEAAIKKLTHADKEWLLGQLSNHALYRINTLNSRITAEAKGEI